MESSPRAGPRLAEHVAVPGEERPGRALAPSVWHAGRTLSTRSPIFLTNARGGVTSAVHRLTMKPKGLWRLGQLDDSRGARWRGGTVTVPFSNPQVFPLRCATSPVVTKKHRNAHLCCRLPRQVLPCAAHAETGCFSSPSVSLFPHIAAVETRCPSQASVTRKCRGRRGRRELLTSLRSGGGAATLCRG